MDMAMKIPKTFQQRHNIRAAGEEAQPIEECILDVTIPESDLTEWCWAAVTVGIAEAYGDTMEMQCDVASRVKHCSCCLPDVDFDCCNKPADDLETPLDSHCGTVFTCPMHRTSDFVKKRIKDGSPIAVRIDWGDGSGHFIVIRGYRVMPKPLGFELHVCDPDLPGMSTPMPFANVLSYYGQAKGFWERSYETKNSKPVPYIICR